MGTDAERLLEQAMKLSQDERAELAVLLADSVGEGSPEQLESEWVDEAKRRLAALRSGETTGVAWEDVERQLRTRRKA